jgi:hypothetical protein
MEQNFRALIQKWISDRAAASSAVPLEATAASSSSSEAVDGNRTEVDPDVLDLVVGNGFYRKVVYALVSREFPSLYVEKFQAASGGRAHMHIKAISLEEQLQRRRAKIEAQKQAFDQKVAPFCFTLLLSVLARRSRYHALHELAFRLNCRSWMRVVCGA